MQVLGYKSRHPTASFLVTGHSLGGALATIAAVDLKVALGITNPLSLYTFGQPRVGNAAFSDYVMKTLGPDNYVRVTHDNDPVPRMPPSAFSFKHGGTEVWYMPGYNTNYTVCDNKITVSENKTCANSLWFSTSVESHRIYLGKHFATMCTTF